MTTLLFWCNGRNKRGIFMIQHKILVTLGNVPITGLCRPFDHGGLRSKDPFFIQFWRESHLWVKVSLAVIC